MLDDKTIVEIQNRGDSRVGYSIPDLNNLRRVFEQNEVKKVTVEEIRKLSYTTGGMNVLKKHMLIKNDELIKELFGKVEPEYYYTEKEVENLLLNGTLDELLDCLDFAPQGVIDLVKSQAIKLEINDLSKRQAILEKTGMDVTKAIALTATDTEKEKEKERRSAVTPENVGGERRTTPKYKVVSK